MGLLHWHWGNNGAIIWLPQCQQSNPKEYRKTSKISRTLVDNKIVDHSDVVGASPGGAAPTTSSSSTQHLVSMDLGENNHKTRRETFKFGDLVQLILEVLQYGSMTCLPWIHKELRYIPNSAKHNKTIWILCGIYSEKKTQHFFKSASNW